MLGIDPLHVTMSYDFLALPTIALTIRHTFVDIDGKETLPTKKRVHSEPAKKTSHWPLNKDEVTKLMLSKVALGKPSRVYWHMNKESTEECGTDLSSAEETTSINPNARVDCTSIGSLTSEGSSSAEETASISNNARMDCTTIGSLMSEESTVAVIQSAADPARGSLDPGPLATAFSISAHLSEYCSGWVYKDILTQAFLVDPEWTANNLLYDADIATHADLQFIAYLFQVHLPAGFVLHNVQNNVSMHYSTFTGALSRPDDVPHVYIDTQLRIISRMEEYNIQHDATYARHIDGVINLPTSGMEGRMDDLFVESYSMNALICSIVKRTCSIAAVGSFATAFRVLLYLRQYCVSWTLRNVLRHAFLLDSEWARSMLADQDIVTDKDLLNFAYLFRNQLPEGFVFYCPRQNWSVRYTSMGALSTEVECGYVFNAPVVYVDGSLILQSRSKLRTLLKRIEKE